MAKQAPAHRAAGRHAGNPRRHGPTEAEVGAARGSSRRAPYVLAALIVCAGGWAYATSFEGAFVFDDFLSIVENPHIRALSPIATVLSAPIDTTLAGRPVASLSFALNYAAAPADARTASAPAPVPYHAVNLGIHLAAALALFGVVRRTLLSAHLRERFAASANWLACAVALLWAVHPLNTEAVTYIVQRAESLMGLFALLALYCAIRAAGDRRPEAWGIAAVGSYLLSLGSKEAAVVVPIVVILWDYVFLQPSDVEGGAWRGRWPLYAALAVASLLLAFTVPGARTRSVGLWLDGWTPWTYLLTQSRVIVHYVRLAFWPSPLVLDRYWTPVRSLAAAAWPMAALSLALALCVVGLVGRTRGLRHAQPAAFAGACFFLLLAPTSSVLPIPTEVAAEHRMYLPLAALISLAVVSAHRATQWFVRGKSKDHRPFRAHSFAAVLVLVVLTMAFATATRARNLDYASDEAIWRDTIAKQPESARARTALGADLVATGRYQEAEAELQASLALDPHRAETLSNLGAAEFALGRIDASIAHLEEAVALRPDFTAAHRNLGAAYRARGRDAEAAVHLRRVLDAQPDHPIVLKDLALLLAVTPDPSLRNGTAALSLAQRAVTLTSRRDPASLAAMGAAYAELGRFDEAVATLREAVTLSADNPALAAQLSHLQNAYAAHETVRQSR